MTADRPSPTAVAQLTAAAPASCTALLDGIPDPAWLVTLADHSIAAANDAAAALFGQPAAALVGRAAAELADSPEDAAWWDAVAGGDASPLRSDTVVGTADGRMLQVSRSLRCVTLRGSGAAPAAAAAPTHALVVLTDRSAERRAEGDRELLVGELQATLESTADGILVTDLQGRIRAFNRRFAEIWAMPLALLEQRDDAAVRAWMTRSVVDEKTHELAQQALRDSPSATSCERFELQSGQRLERVTRPMVVGGITMGRVDSFRDLSERLAALERIETLSNCDALTGLPNRARLAERVAAAAADSRRGGGSFALLVVDLDRFRRINESLGHDAGDRVLFDTARRIAGCLRQHDTLARLGGDQFALLLGQADAQAVEAAARRVLAVVSEPHGNEASPFTLTCSIGIALAPSHGSTIEELARHADAAMRAVKAAGRAHFRLHQVRETVDRREQMRLDHAMRQALVSNRFRLHYQPQVEMATGRIVGAEALLRWRDPELGEMSPSRFVAAAEDSGFIVALGDWVLTQAVRQAAQWQQRGHELPVAVNVSALQFRQPGFVDRVAGVLAASRLSPRRLELELTESILVADADEALLRLDALASLGVRLALDDFGTGHSSLADLKRFPIGRLKVDPSFVTGLPGDPTDAGIVAAIVQMARALGMRVIAEGVETEAQRQFLLEAGCDEFQGWLFAPALDSLSLEERLTALAVEPGPGAGAPPRIRLVSG